MHDTHTSSNRFVTIAIGLLIFWLILPIAASLFGMSLRIPMEIPGLSIADPWLCNSFFLVFVLLTGFSGYLHFKSLFGAGIGMLLWAPLIIFIPLQFTGLMAIILGLTCLILWWRFGW